MNPLHEKEAKFAWPGDCPISKTFLQNWLTALSELMRKRLVIAVCFLAVALVGYDYYSSTRAWPPKGYSEVRAFLYNLDSRDGLPCVTNRHLDPSMTDTNGVRLSDVQLSRFLAPVTDTHPEHGAAACSVPHHAYIFYDRKHRIVGWVELCFGCLNYRTSSPHAPLVFDIFALENLTRELGLPVLQKEADYATLKRKDTE